MKYVSWKDIYCTILFYVTVESLKYYYNIGSGNFIEILIEKKQILEVFFFGSLMYQAFCYIFVNILLFKIYRKYSYIFILCTISILNKIKSRRRN